MIFIRNGYIKTMAGADLENGCILLDDNGTIAAVGADLTAPQGAEIIDAEFPETSFPARFLHALLEDPKEAQLAYELLCTLKEEKK